MTETHAHPHSHGGGEPHVHPHPDTAAVEAHNAGAGSGPVVVDIGGDVGALVLTASAEMAHAEIDITPEGADDVRSHVAVLPRTFVGAVRYAAVYPSLREGRWNLWHPHGSGGSGVALTVEIRGGQVTEAAWPVSSA